MAKEFKPDRFINCDSEQKKFAEMLDLREKRILVVEDPHPNGKTYLLQKLRLDCRKKRIPHCLISLKEHKEMQDYQEVAPIALLKMIGAELLDYEVIFRDFLAKETAMRSGNQYALFNLPPPNLQATINVGNDNFQNVRDVTIVGNQINQGHLDLQKDKTARNAVTNAFFTEIKQLYNEQTMVIMIDDYDDIRALGIEEFFVDRFLDRLAFNSSTRPEKLLLVIAGRSGPDFTTRTDEERKEVAYLRPLNRWNDNHLRQYMSAVNVTDPSVFSAAELLLHIDYPIEEIVNIIDFRSSHPG